MKAKKIAKISALVLLFISIFIILGGVFYAFWVTKDVKLDKNALNLENTETVKLKTDNGEVLDYFSSVKTSTPYEKISPYTVYAFVSLEDKRFFEHNGLDYKRILGATYNNIKVGYFKEGGSTITQQLAKNALLSQEKTIERKLKEAKLSIEIERKFSKEEIITMYLNTIYFGHSLYGIEAASKRLFDKEPIDLSISESAILAGIVKNPLRNSPLNSVENALERRNLVLRLMLEQGYINESQHETAMKESYVQPEIKETSTKRNIPYTQVVISEASTLLGLSEREIISGGYEIHTYFNESEQNILNNAYYSSNLQVENAKKTYLLADNTTGGVTAYISSVNYSPFEFRRQSASAIKPLISYAPALEQGLIIPDSPILDEKCCFGDYSPSNYQNSYLGWTTVKESLMTSSNACSVKLLDLAGKDYSFKLLNDFGISLCATDGLASALGGTTYGQTPIELTSAYMTIANGGISKELSFIKAIYDKKGKLIYKHENSNKRVISTETAYYLTDMLLGCSKSGTAKKLRTLPFEIASKTGTNGNKDGNFDAWNLSYTTKRTLCSWYGSNDYKTPLPLEVSGGSYPTLGAKYIYENLAPSSDFIMPYSLNYAQIDKFLFENYHILRLASENTPLEYQKSVIVNEKNYIPTSDYFDNSLPNDFEVVMGDGEVVITLSKSNKFRYHIENGYGVRLFSIEKGSGTLEIALPKPNFGIDLYYVVSTTDDNVIVDKSPPKAVFVW